MLAYHDHNGNGAFDGIGSSDEVVLLGGINVVLTGQISLDPLEDINETGTTHTVTAMIVDGSGNPLSGETVDFVVTSGPNSGETGMDTTDANGHASFTYTDSGGVGTDTIEASFTDATGVIRTVTAKKTWVIGTCDDLLISLYDPIADRVQLVNVGDAPISIDGCSFVAYDVFTELSIGAATMALSGIIQPGETIDLVFPSSIPDGPGGIAVLDAPPPPDGTPVGAVLADDITGMVYLDATMVFGVAHLRVPAHNAIYDCIYGGSGVGPFFGPFTSVAACLGGP